MNYTHNTNIINLEFINKFYINKGINIPCLEKIIIRSSIMDSEYEQTTIFAKTMSILEIITFQRSFIKNYKTFLKGKGQKHFSFNSIVTLRNNNMLNFLYFFIHYILVNLKENFLDINKYIYNFNYSFTIKDISIFPTISEFFIKWKYPLFISISINNKKKLHLNFILRNYSIFTEVKDEIFK
jgi:ribosomal protein L5